MVRRRIRAAAPVLGSILLAATAVPGAGAAPQVGLPDSSGVGATGVAPHFAGTLEFRVPAPGTRGPQGSAPFDAELSEQPPAEFTATPAFRSPAPLYGTVRLGKGGRMFFALDQADPQKPAYDRLWLDRDQDRDLTNDGPAIEGVSCHVDARNRDYTEFTGVPLDLYYGNGPRETYRFTLYLWYPRAGAPRHAFVIAASWREGTVTLEDGKARVAVLDDDADGLYDVSSSRWTMIPEGPDADVLTATWKSTKTPIRMNGKPYVIRTLSSEGGHVELTFSTENDAFNAELEADPTLAEPPRTRSDEPIAWAASLDEAMRAATKGGKPLFIFASVPWSRGAEQFEERTLRDAEVRRLLDEYVCVRIDPDREADLAERFAIEASPTVVIADAAGAVIDRIVGYRPARSFAVDLRGHRQ